mgnify:FL=1
MTVRVEGGRVRLLVRLTRPLGWSRVRAAVCAAAGLPQGTTLHFGAGAIPDHWTVGMPPLVAGCEIATFADDEVPDRPPVMLTVLAGPDAGACVPMGTRSVRVGRDAAADLVLTDAAVSLRHAVIEPTATGLVVRDMRSTNGVFVDGVPVDGVTMAGTGSIIRIGNGVLQVQLTAEPAGAFRPDGAGHLVRDRCARRAAEAPTMLPAPPSAPEPRTRRGLPLISAAAGGAVGGVLALVLRNPLFLAFAAFGPLTMIGTAVGDRVRGRRSYRRQRTGYAADLAGWRASVAAAVAANRRAAWRAWPGPAELLRCAQIAGARLWDRAPGDLDYLRLAVGNGARTVPVPGASVAGGAVAGGSVAGGAVAGAAVVGGSVPAVSLPVAGGDPALPTTDEGLPRARRGSQRWRQSPREHRSRAEARSQRVHRLRAGRRLRDPRGTHSEASADRTERDQWVSRADPVDRDHRADRSPTASAHARRSRDPHASHPGGWAGRTSQDVVSAGPAGDTGGEPGAIVMTDMPIALPLRGVLALTGPTGRGLARWLIAQLACAHSPAHVALLILDARDDLLPCLDLPHAIELGLPVGTDSRRDAGVAAGPEAWTGAGRGAVPGAGSAAPHESGLATVADAASGRDLVVVLDGPAAIRSELGRRVMAAVNSPAPPESTPGGSAGPIGAASMPRIAAVLCLAESAHALPPGAAPVSSQFAPMRAPGGAASTAGSWPAAPGPASLLPVAPTMITPDLLRQTCRALAPLRDAAQSGPTTLPSAVDLTALTGPIDADLLLDRWRAPTLRAPIGIGADGPVTVDLAADGPHLLIAGTTGSGKSELLQTLICSLAAGASPTAVTFLLVDYKGGAAFRAVTDLPHVVGVLTDLDPAESARALTSLRAELRQRERLAAAGDGAPDLVVVIDEFATLAAELPEFLTGVLDIAQRGRSLGLHLVLATQRPAGVVTPAIRANISTRICLRVTDPADSIDVIGSAAAAHISARHPGRAFLTTGGAPVPFQIASVSGCAPPDVQVLLRSGGASSTGPSDRPPDAPAAARSDIITASEVVATLRRDDAGTAPPHEGVPPEATTASKAALTRAAITTAPPHDSNTALPPAGGPDESRLSILGTLVTAARDAAGGAPPGRRPWLPPLPLEFPVPDDHPNCLAVADVPEEQACRLLDLPESSVLVTGPPGSGRSTALRRVAQIAAGQGAELIVIDGAGGLADLARWPAVTSYLDLRDPPLLLRVLALLADPARRPSDAHVRYLIVDHYDLAAAELERADYLTGTSLLAELTARSGGTVRIVASGPEALAHQRAAGAFRTQIELGCADRDAPPGRGRWDGVDVQLTVCSADRGTAESTAASTTRSAPAAFVDPVVVRPLPVRVATADLRSPDPAHVAIGIGGDEARPITVDLTSSGGGIVIAGPRRSGVSNALNVLADQAAAAGIPVVVLRTTAHADPSSATPIDAPSGTVAIRDPERRLVIPTRREPRALDIRRGTEHLRTMLSAHDGPILLIADHAGMGDEYPAAGLLEQFLTVCTPGQNLALGARADVLTRARRGHLREALAARRGLLLTPDAADGALFDLTLPKRRRSVPGRGVWVECDLVTPIQIASP